MATSLKHLAVIGFAIAQRPYTRHPLFMDLDAIEPHLVGAAPLDALATALKVFEE